MQKTLEELKKKSTMLTPRMWKGWGKKDTGEVGSGFYARDRGRPLMGLESLLRLFQKKVTPAVWVRGAAGEKKEAVQTSAGARG